MTQLAFTFEAVREASLLARQVQAEMISAALSKTDLSPVTVADFAVQALVASRLEQAFPRDPLVAEEDPTFLRTKEGLEVLTEVTDLVKRFIPDATPAKICEWVERGTSEPSSRFWTLDPIDGTKGFLRGGQYAVALALIENGEIQVAALGCPELSLQSGEKGIVVFGAKNQGAWSAGLDRRSKTGRALHVSNCTDPKNARLIRSFEGRHTDIKLVDQVGETLGTQSPPIAMDSQAKYLVLAAGQAELLVRSPAEAFRGYQEKIWDHAAGALLVEEAGGQITDLDGKPLDFSRGRTLSANNGILASNRHLHEPAIRVIREIRGQR